ncbi:putative nuclear RNA export factor SDE5 isoform X2 [Prosopis cineraria]|uniref:putative nuclear RNA export factor SDE5 isoform X2 n=1 Tax=Prosopis cineraria TaxID=364024 RepID=UPI00240EA24D|nr:putative nuclear RNA export factor SDE5 isoform X2 [Prosopis cineraria]
MLGHGFQLDREKIREVLDNCGYDMKKSMDKLMGESILTSDEVARVVGEFSGRSTDRERKSEVPSYEIKSQNVNYPGSKVSNDGVDLHWHRKDREELQQEVLTSLSQICEHSEESSKKIIEGGKKLSPYREVVNEPPEDSPEEYETDTNYLGQENIDPEDEDEYQNLRKAVKEYRATMIEYHRAAVDASVKGDSVKAKKLMEEGQLFLTKAREADDESNKMIVETKNGESQDFMVDLRQQGPKEILRVIKCHLSLSAAFKYLKVIIDESNQDFSEGSPSQKRKRRIVKLLEKESLAWDEGETVGTIMVCLDKIGHTKPE